MCRMDSSNVGWMLSIRSALGIEPVIFISPAAAGAPRTIDPTREADNRQMMSQGVR